MGCNSSKPPAKPTPTPAPEKKVPEKKEVIIIEEKIVHKDRCFWDLSCGCCKCAEKCDYTCGLKKCCDMVLQNNFSTYNKIFLPIKIVFK